MREVNLKAPIINTNHCKVDLDLLLSVEANHHHIKKSEHHIHMDSVLAIPSVTTKFKFEKFLDKLPENIFRIKGYVTFGKKQYLVNYVGGRFSFVQCLSSQTSKKDSLVFIGDKLNSAKITSILAKSL